MYTIADWINDCGVAMGITSTSAICHFTVEEVASLVGASLELAVEAGTSPRLIADLAGLLAVLKADE